MREYSRVRLCSAVTIALMAVTCGVGSTANAVQRPAAVAATPGQYCGVYCVYGACRALGQRTGFRGFLRSRYVGSTKGSSFAELVGAIHDRGLAATLVRRLNLSTLVHCPWPVILHVRSDVEQATPNHFVLYLGVVHGKAIVMDPPAAPQPESFRRIAAVWDGKGIIVSTQVMSLAGIFGLAYGRFLALLAVLVSLVIIAHKLRRGGRLQAVFRGSAGPAAVQALGIVILAALMGVVQNVAGRAGLLAPSTESRQLLRIYNTRDLPHIGFAAAKALVAQGAVVIDARLPSDYRNGHIPGAINIPPGTAPQSRAELLAGVGKSSPIMVYCESSGCPLAAMLANRLEIDGYSRVCVFTGGWRRWKAGVAVPASVKKGNAQKGRAEP